MTSINDKVYNMITCLADQYGFDADEGMDIVENQINTLIKFVDTDDILSFNHWKNTETFKSIKNKETQIKYYRRMNACDARIWITCSQKSHVYQVKIKSLSHIGCPKCKSLI